MKSAFFALTLATAIFAAPSSVHARQMPTLDMDALLFSSESVVEGSIVAEHKVTYDRFQPPLTLLDSTDVKVEKTLAGTDLRGKTVNVGNVSLYRKGLLGARSVRAEKRVVDGKETMVWVPLSEAQQPKISHLEKGDRAIFFLEKARFWRETDVRPADFWVVSSGVRLVKKGAGYENVSGFSQMSNPGPYMETFPVARAVFDAGFAASRARVNELKLKLAAPPSADDTAFFQKWAQERANSKKARFWRGSDAISLAVAKRLREIEALNR